MPAPSSPDLLAVFDRGPLNARYWTSFILLAGVYVLDFFDFFLIAFILAVIGPRWHLTYGQAALILYGSGVGAILGSLIWGSLSDVFGRKLQTVTGTLICGVAAGLIGLLPTGAYVPLAILRIFVGFGLAAAITPALTIVVEMTPTRWRSGLTSLFVVTAAIGPWLASFTAHALLHAIGWRGLAMLGLLPILIGVLVWMFVPESVRWLAAKGRFAAARAAVARHFGMPARSGCRCRARRPVVAAAGEPRRTLFGQSRLFWQDFAGLGRLDNGGLRLSAVGADYRRPRPACARCRGPRHISSTSRAARWAGKLLIAVIAQRLGRRRVGIVFGFLAAVGSHRRRAISTRSMIGGFPLFVILIAGAAFFVDGSLGNLAPYTIEQYGVRLGSPRFGLGPRRAGIGKILGPLALAVIAGTGNIISPHATPAAVFPAFLFLAVCMLLVGLSFVFLAVETHGRAMALEPEPRAVRSQPAAARR